MGTNMKVTELDRYLFGQENGRLQIRLQAAGSVVLGFKGKK